MTFTRKHVLAAKRSSLFLGLSLVAVAQCKDLFVRARFTGREPAEKSSDLDGPSADAEARCLVQADFGYGTVFLDEPGTYKLCGDIVFDPYPPVGDQTPAESYDVYFEGVYNRSSFGLGFFSAISVVASDVTIMLNGYTLEQSVEHSLMQRYFALIELTNAPFIADTGPSQFVSQGECFKRAINFNILGPGTLGRSSHHGIHGNENKKVWIQDVTFRDFEVAAVSLNNVDGLVIRDCHVEGNRHDVPVNGMMSAARFIRPYGQALKEMGYEMELRGSKKTASELYDALISAINNSCDDIVHGNGKIDQDKHPSEFELFDNPLNVIDGPCYAFLVNGKGPAVGGQGYDFSRKASEVSSNVVIENNDIRNIKCWNKEIPALVVNNKVQNDARGAVLQLVSMDGTGIAMNDDGTYKGNSVADMQIMVAKAIHEGVLQDKPLLQTGVNTIDPEIVQWAESKEGVLYPKFRCNGDSMHHVVKGMIAIRVEETRGFDIRGNTIENVENISPLPFSKCTDFHAGASSENAQEQQLGNVRGISVAASRAYRHRDSTIERNLIHNLDSENGDWVIGIDCQGDTSGVKICSNEVNLQDGVVMSDKYLALRIRAHSDGASLVVEDDNMFYQQAQDLSSSRRLRPAPMIPPHEMEVSPATGVCPFAGILWQP